MWLAVNHVMVTELNYFLTITYVAGAQNNCLNGKMCLIINGTVSWHLMINVAHTEYGSAVAQC